VRGPARVGGLGLGGCVGERAYVQDASECVLLIASRSVPVRVWVPVGSKCARACASVRARASLYVFAKKASFKVEHVPLEMSRSIFMSKFSLFSMCALVDMYCYFSNRIQRTVNDARAELGSVHGSCIQVKEYAPCLKTAIVHSFWSSCLRRARHEALSCPVWIDSHVYMSGFRTDLCRYHRVVAIHT
jgi:hypothetical protein